ncbi:DUF4432 family protein [Paenibacillus mesophilus]|uniref:aldose 1-epimerase family protein n=1 Tax=Paenibacillus mesophilus TaxID=2582849 RepID=UPI00110E5647|nr:aldose 1-epimerase family protein [Paenibacillus mesophilus]TMV44628.1 DUF4432 family protein [Paenibacillus mesophilus]
MLLYGKQWTRRELEARAGNIGQLGGIRRWRLVEGKEAGVDVIQIRTGAGLEFEVTPEKGLDISLAELFGASVSWQSPSGNVHPMHYEPEGVGWLRTASGGLLMTCGLSHAGSPSDDETGSYGLHGRAHHTPARQVTAVEQWKGDELELRVSGIVEETSIAGSKLRLVREIISVMGQNRITIRDRVENFGFRPAPHLMLYHFNFGFPLLGEQTTVTLPQALLDARDPGTPTDSCGRWQAPDANIVEQVFYHRLLMEKLAEPGVAEARIHNPCFPMGGVSRPLTVKLRWSADTLPLLVQWRMPGAGEHVLGLEPSNCIVGGREAVMRDNGSLPALQPGGSIEYKLELIMEAEG